MSDYSAFFLMKPEDVKRYAVEVLHFFQPEEETDCVEIGDGNINYVFQVRSRKDGRSVIVKQADKLLRSSGRPLDLYRNKIEAETLMLEARLAPKFIPEVYHYDETMAALSMEDISAYKNLRKELAAGRVYDHLSENLSDFLAQSLLPTTDLVMDRQEKKKQVKFFTNPELCDITEDLVLTEPYLAQPMNPRNKNIVTPGNEDFVRARLYEDEALHGEVAALRNGFMNNAQALIHGDLHSGSIFANEQGIKVIDPEFAFYGPMGYDIGNVIGNLFFAWANKAYTGGSAETQTALEQTIRETCDKTAEKVKFFTNPELCDITEDLVLTEPYLAQPMNPRNKNIVTPGNEDFVRARLYEDEALHGEVAALRNGFMNNAQALIHGDLHSGSIFANEQGIKVIDPEFAFYGPMGYDIGNVIGNLFFAWANKAYTGGSAETQTALEQTIRETCDKTAEKLAAEYDKLVKFPLYRAPAFRKAYLDGVMADAYGYAGTEIIRRVVGDSKVMEVTSVTDPAQRLPMERALIKLGIYLIKNRACGLTGAAVTEKFREILSEGRESYGQNG